MSRGYNSVSSRLAARWRHDQDERQAGRREPAADIREAVVDRSKPARYCGPCEKLVPASERECKACGADTDKAFRCGAFLRSRATGCPNLADGADGYCEECRLELAELDS